MVVVALIQVMVASCNVDGLTPQFVDAVAVNDDDDIKSGPDLNVDI